MNSCARGLLVALAALLLGACSSAGTRDNGSAVLEGSWQVVLVTTPDWNAAAGSLRTFEREGDHWQEVGSARPVTIGRKGAAWGDGLNPAQEQGPQKREGDGRSPAGVFSIGSAFGYPLSVDTGLEYQSMSESHWCMDVSGSPYYNRIVDANEVGADAVKGSSEPMRRDVHVDGDQRYRIGFVVEHNQAGVAERGSCIFAHVWKSPTDATAGCTAMSDQDMQALLEWLRKPQLPRFVLLPEKEYARLKAQWKLP